MARFVPIAKELAVGKVLYMLKAPLKDYRAYPKVTEMHDLETGEVHIVPTGRIRQRKQDLKPGLAVRMCKVLGDKTMDQLIFAGRGGTHLRDFVLEDALTEIASVDARFKAEMDRLFYSKAETSG